MKIVSGLVPDLKWMLLKNLTRLNIKTLRHWHTHTHTHTLSRLTSWIGIFWKVKHTFFSYYLHQSTNKGVVPQWILGFFYLVWLKTKKPTIGIKSKKTEKIGDLKVVINEIKYLILILVLLNWYNCQLQTFPMFHSVLRLKF